ncbi:MAG: hypothetical protein ACRYFZ_17290 [Janthinobacterium lividum]
MKQLLFGLALLSLGACKKDDPNALPTATQEGSNTAGFLLDGQPWLPKGSTLSSNVSGIDATWNPSSKQRSVRLGFGRYGDNDITSFGFYLPYLKTPGTIKLDQSAPLYLGNSNPSYALYLVHQPSPDRYFLTGPNAHGQVNITRFDTIARVVSGTFETRVQEDGGTATHEITQGRFDIKF